jgi:hypothetical protein
MTEIPLEIQMHAERLWDEGGYQSPPEIIARAILAERERCVEAVRRAAALDENGYIAEKGAVINEIMAALPADREAAKRGEG